MAKTVNPAKIGLFVLVGAFLAAATIIYVGSLRILAKEETFVLYFSESVNGLNIGSPVKFKGVRIGAVSDIRLFYNQDPSVRGAYIPVFVKIDEGRVRDDFDVINIFDPRELENQVQQGLRGRLQLESIITGQLFVELDYSAAPGDPFIRIQADSTYKEIPTLPSIMAEIGSSTADVLATIATFDFRDISDQLALLLRRLNEKIDAFDAVKINQSIVSLGDNFERLLSDMELQPTLDRVNALLEDLQSLSSKLDSSIDPALAEYQKLMTQLEVTLAHGNKVLANLDQLTAPEAAIQRDLSDTLAEIQRTARSARELIEYLERNPRALLSGRAEP